MPCTCWTKNKFDRNFAECKPVQVQGGRTMVDRCIFLFPIFDKTKNLKCVPRAQQPTISFGVVRALGCYTGSAHSARIAIADGIEATPARLVLVAAEGVLQIFDINHSPRITLCCLFRLPSIFRASRGHCFASSCVFSRFSYRFRCIHTLSGWMVNDATNVRATRATCANYISSRCFWIPIFF